MSNLQNDQTHSNNSSAVAGELFECVWPFCGIGALRVNSDYSSYRNYVRKVGNLSKNIIDGL